MSKAKSIEWNISKKAQQELRNITLQTEKKIKTLQKEINQIQFNKSLPTKSLNTITLRMKVVFSLDNNIDAISKSCEKAFDAFLKEGSITSAKLVIK